MRNAILLFVGTWAAAVLAAGDLKAPYTLETTGVLPRGIISPRYLTLFMSLKSQFGDEGATEPLGTRLNRPVAWRDFLGAQSAPTRALFEQVLQRAGIAADGTAGLATGSVSAAVNAKLPYLAVGITDKLSAAVILPIVSIDMTVDTGFSHSADGRKFLGAICQARPDKCQEITNGFQNVTAMKLAALGYEPLRSHTVSGIGDAQLIGKYKWLASPDQSLSQKLIVHLPTGTSANPDNALDVTTGELRYRVGTLLAYDRRLGAGFGWNAHGAYHALLPNRMVKRLPASETDFLSPDKADVQRALGHRFLAGTGVDYTFPKLGLTLTGGYSFQHQSKTSYDGDATDPATRARYGYLEAFEPAQTLHSMVWAGSFSTVSWYRDGRFFLPLELNVVYSRPFAGRNSPSGSVISGELIAFF